MKLQIAIPHLPGMPHRAEIEVASPGDVVRKMKAEGCEPDYIRRVLEHLGPIFAADYPEFYKPQGD